MARKLLYGPTPLFIGVHPKGVFMFNKKGFTLVELMIVVAIIGILAAIAIPNFIAMQYRSKRSELPTNVEGIKTAELAYEAAYDTYVDATVYPRDTPDKTMVIWDVGGSAGFATIGWAPSGSVRGIYEAAVNGTTDFTVTGQSDVDGDGDPAIYTATKSVNPTLKTANNIY
jgi:type IV pilus assembly protein PilA